MIIIKEKYYSNCLIESLKNFIASPLNIKVIRKGSFRLIWRKGQFPHFYWYNKSQNKYWHFEAKYSDEPLLGQLWFEGSVKEFRFHNTQ